MKIIKKKETLITIIVFTLLLIGLIIFIIHKSYSVELENDTEVEPNTELTYYLDVKYDGVDRFGVHSSDSSISDIKSGIITITDKIPSGLTFNSFVTTEDGTIGAVQRGNELISCPGKVIDGTNEASPTQGQWNTGETEYTYHGLHYNKNNNTVSFKVEKLMAGCVLTVGIKTQTPSTIDDPETTVVETRRDFYNFGEAVENKLSKNSNTVHVYMGKETETTHRVTYSYTGTVPNGITAPNVQDYTEGSKVTVAKNPNVPGYTFSGWNTSSVTVTDGAFTMPNSDVTFTGSFTEVNKKTVTYNITGTTPEGYVLPSVKSYSPGETIDLDGLKTGDVIGGYRFLGWQTNDVTVNDNQFIMPNSNVTITGSFEEVKYKVTYKFHNTVLPPNSESLLPSTQSYKPGVTVTLASNPTASGYKFLGWYHDNNFTMPEEDIIIYGEWKKEAGTFSPSISQEIVDKKKNYKTGDEITFKITITNTSSFAIKDVMIKEEGANFITGSGYSTLSDHMAKVEAIPANDSAIIYAKYTVKDTDIGTKKSTAYIKGALSNNDYVLEDNEYKSETNYNIGSIIVINNIVKGTMANTNKYFKVKVNIDCENPEKYTIQGQDSNISYDGTSVNTSSTYTCGDNNYIYLKHGQEITIGGGTNDSYIAPETIYSIVEQDATNYNTYINNSSNNNKSSGNLSTSTNEIINNVSIINTYYRDARTGLFIKNLKYVLLTIIVITILILIYIFKLKKKK